MDIQTAFYHARFQHLRNVLQALGPVRVAKAMTAFEDGQSNWGHCFFARAFEDEIDLRRPITVPEPIAKRGIYAPEYRLMQALGFTTVIPIRFVWQAFDRHGSGTTRLKLKDMCDQIMSGIHDEAVDKFLAEVQFDAGRACEVVCA